MPLLHGQQVLENIWASRLWWWIKAKPEKRLGSISIVRTRREGQKQEQSSITLSTKSLSGQGFLPNKVMNAR